MVRSGALGNSSSSTLGSCNGAAPVRCQGTPTRWTPSQAAAFLQTNHGTYGDQLARAFEVLLGAGMRRRELPGLHWPKVHPAEQMLLVRWNLTAVDNNHLHLGHPKTKASRHWISLSARVVSALERQAAAARASLPEHAPLEGLVFCQPDGAPLRPQQLLVTLRQVDGDRSPRIGVHDLRRTAASSMVSSGDH